MISSSDILNSKILIVDDQEADVLLLERLLRGGGYVSVTSTMNSNEVCEFHRKHRYDLILLDLEMPGMDFSGFQVMEGLKEIETGNYLPVIVITAHPDYKLQALQTGAMDFISKPFELAEVLARVHNVLQVRLLHQETKNHSKALEQKVQEAVAQRDLIRRQNVEIKRLYDKIVSMEGALAPTHFPPGVRLHTLLYVEDDLANLQLVEKIITRRTDLRLLTAINGINGIEIARTSRPEVILMDINLPDMSGFNALETLRKDPATAHIPVIALTANVTALNIATGLEAGFFRYITKPINVDEFMEALDIALEFAGKNYATNT